MKKRILVLGMNGMLGHIVHDYLLDTGKYSVFGLNRKSLNALQDEKDIEKIIANYSPNYIINCIGLINKYTSSDGELAKKINGIFPHLLSYLSIKNNYRLIHISTDCYLDEDFYGKSKRLGEINDTQNLTIRTSIIGPELKDGYGLFHWFMSQQGEANGFTKAHWDGVTTLQLSKFIEEHIDSKNYTGIIDYRTKNSITKHDLIKLISEIFNKNIKILEDNREIKDKRNFNPDVWCLKDYSTQLTELKDYMKKNKEKYARYGLF
jgi:dTDP-4-dehydrorhamnose reductase